MEMSPSQSSLQKVTQDLALQFFNGHLCSTPLNQLACQVQRVVIAGNSILEHSKINEVFRGSYRAQQTNKEVYDNIQQSLHLFD
jgi:DNA polymerase delta subunit 2